MHPHGVKYTKPHEGAYYADGSDMTGDYIMPGVCAYYSWAVPETAGPGPGDSSTKAWLYHGHVSETGDTNAGLVGRSSWGGWVRHAPLTASRPTSTASL